jgi:nucleoside-diphosphate-sugar epimerase
MNVDFNRASVLVTGGTGFIGRHLVAALLQQGVAVKVLSRRPSDGGGRGCPTIVGDLADPATLDGICQDADTIFHLAGHAHTLDEPDGESAALSTRITVEGTRALLAQARRAGVRAFIYISSVKSMGEGGDARLDETAECRPETAYGKARYAAEQLVLDSRNDFSVTVLRLPMVYGPGCKGNLLRMIRAVAHGRFPSLPETGNRRSMVDVRDVVQAAFLATGNPVAAGKTYIVTDSQTYSTRQIYEWICAALTRPIPRWTVPLAWLRVAAGVGDVIGQLAGRRFFLDSQALDKLIGSAWYSSEKISRELGYRPAYTLKNALPEMVAEFGKNS